MAEEEQTEDQEGGGGKGKLIMLVVLALVLVGLSVGGTILALSFLGGDEEAEVSEEEAAAAAEVVEEAKPAIYYPLKPTLLVNYNVRGRQRFLQADLSLMVRDDDVVAAIEQHSAMLQHSLLMLFGSQEYTELQTAEGKELVRQMALDEIRRLVEQEIGKPGVEQVLFTNLVMQ